MERVEAYSQLSTLVGKDLRQMADEYSISVWVEGKKNKGWAGHTIERFLGLPLNSSRSPNFGSWELKVVPLKPTRSGLLTVKETMAITMIDPVEVAQKDFEDSHLLNKLRKIIVVARVFESQLDARSLLHSVAMFDLDDPDIYNQVRNDYNIVRDTIRNQGFSELTGAMGKLVQPRTKGPGHGSTSRAFYARVGFVAHILGKGHSVPLPVQAD
jgi:DNA mismatch repair protein MutH